MRASLSVLLAIAVSTVALAAPVPKAVKKKPDAEVLAGEWETIVSESNGQFRAPSGVYRWNFDTDLTLRSHPTGQSERAVKWTVKIAPGQSPKEIDLTDGKMTYKGIYEFDGGDLRIAYATGDRPANFDPKSGVYYNVLRRVEKK